ncbi:MAG: winged helix-turn-helix transcriptional regulator [Ardenticatenia bacterium]|nr:winged helix-turn-helix transcriptional regulator [Ardenticatenia bacterium]
MNKETLERAQTQANICGVFSSATRVCILWVLAAEKEKSVGEIASSVGSSLQNTSQHLRLMKDKGVVTSRREGQTVYYRIKRNDLVDRCRLLLQEQQR